MVPAPRVVCSVLAFALLAGPAPAQDVSGALADFPEYDQVPFLHEGLRRQLLRRLQAAAPSLPETITALVEANQLDEALEGISVGLTGGLEQAMTTLDVLARYGARFRSDEPRGYVGRLRTAIEPVRATLGTGSREDDARLAYALFRVDWLFNRQDGPSARRIALEQFASQYSGTETALLAAVDLIEESIRDLIEKVAALDRFWRDHPGSIAGAKALYLKGFHLSGNFAVTGVEPRGTDPTNRFLQVVEIVKELQSGRYPACQWVGSAPDLVTSFYVSREPRPSISAQNIERMLSAYREFVLTLLPSAGPRVHNSVVSWIVTRQMGDLYEWRGDRVAGLEELFANLETTTHHTSAIRSIKGAFYLHESTAGASERREEMRRKARDTFAALAADDDSLARFALATLAAMANHEGDCTTAVAHYRTFGTRYPGSPWSWVAELRAGQCLEVLGQWREAAAAYERVAANNAATDLPARPLAYALAADARTEAGDFAGALPAMQQAVATWNDDFGGVYDFAPFRVLREVTPGIARLRGRSYRFDRSGLADRANRLASDLKLPDGLRLARGRWQLQTEQLDAAIETLGEFTKRSPSPEGRELRRRAEFLAALGMAGGSSGATRTNDALRRLEWLTTEPAFDFISAAAHLAISAIRIRDGGAGQADDHVRAALDGLVARKQPAQANEDALTRDLSAIRALVFRPAGDLPVYQGSDGQRLEFHTSAPSYGLVNADLVFKVANGPWQSRDVAPPLPQLPNAAYLRSDELRLLVRILVSIGGIRTQAPAAVTQVPNQPIGASKDIASIWNRHFPVIPGHWSGWLIETFPMISSVEFIDDARTRAMVRIRTEYRGGTVLVEKDPDGVWRAIRLSDLWIE